MRRRERESVSPASAGVRRLSPAGRPSPGIDSQGVSQPSSRHGSRTLHTVQRRHVSMCAESMSSSMAERRRYPLEPTAPGGSAEDYYKMNPKSLRLQLDLSTPPPPAGYSRPTTAPCSSATGGQEVLSSGSGGDAAGADDDDDDEGDSLDPFMPKNDKNVSLETTVLFETALAEDMDYASLTRSHAVRAELGLLNSIVAHDGALYYIRNNCIEKAQLAQEADFTLPSKQALPESARILQPQRGVPSVLAWDNYSTGVAHSIYLDEEDSRAVPAHLSTQGAVFGLQCFADGIHLWNVECSLSDLGNVSYGIVSKMGTDSFHECKTGALPPFLACLRPSLPGEHRIHWKDVEGNARSRALRVPLSMCGLDDMNVLSVVLDFHFKQVTFLCNDAEVDRVDFQSDADADPDADVMLGDHTVFAHVKNGAKVQLVRRKPHQFLPFESAVQGVQNPKIYAGNPYMRWGQKDGVGMEAAFQLPLGACAFNNSIWVTDCATIREIDTKTGTVATHHPVITPHNSQLPIQYLGAIHSVRGKFYVTDITNRTVLCVDPGTWEARVVLTKGQYGFLPAPAEKRDYIAELVSECFVYDTAAALFPPVVEEGLARLIEARGQRIMTRRRSRKSTGGGSAMSLGGAAAGGNAAFSAVPSTTLKVQAHHVHPIHLSHIPPAWLFFTDSERHCIFYAEMGTAKAALEYRNCPHVCAGVPGEPGKADGQGVDARLRHPTTIIADFGGLLLYVADTGNARIAKIQLVWNEIKRNYTGQVTSLNHVTTLDDEEHSFCIRGVTGLAVLNESATCLLAGQPQNDAIYQVQLQPTFKQSGPAFASPYDQLVMMLRQAKTDAESLPQVPAEHCRALSRAVDLLIGTPNIYQVEYVGGGLDEDVARFLSDTYAPGGVSGLEDGHEDPGDTLGQVKPLKPTSPKRSLATSQMSPPASPKAEQKSPRPATANAFGSGVSRVLGHDISNLDSLDCDVFEISRLVDHDAGGVLVQVSVNIFSKYRFFNKYFGGPENVHRLIQFLTRIQAGYHRENPYHNHIHAADVLQTVHWMINVTGIANKLSDVETLALLLSAVVHDYDHPGVNNMFLINTQHEIALHFNDQSVLENHHLYCAFKVMRLETFAILEPFTDYEQRQIRDHMINHVLGTDMKHHFKSLGDLKARLANLKDAGSGKADFMANADDKALMLKSLLHAADISNPVKPKDNYVEWAERVMKEFRGQGKKEEEKDLPTSPFCDKDADIAKCQKGFIDFVVRPLFAVLVDAYPSLKPMLDNLDANLQYWKDRDEEGKQQQQQQRKRKKSE
eukprot:TRINITY_DN9684_c0_g1_i1.p1 TRINITY_DN9684_c0_g1~~TRINITY_DN9684_c0_g1_i1.p1  ORF type:complete len:1296 (+),score=474.69 TRINITY_DN9684_c0_g1_i1:96-3983(+)